MQFNQLSLKHKTVFDKYLSYRQHCLSAYAFENIFVWKNLYKIFWAKIDDCLCVFFKDKIGCFLYLPPLGKETDANVTKKCFEIMASHNENKVISRIENVEGKDIGFYEGLGYTIILGGDDYVCRKIDLANLKGNMFKKKRATANAFSRNYKFRYQNYNNAHKTECLNLYKSWMYQRKEVKTDAIYQRLLEDNFTAFKAALDCYAKLNLAGRIIKIDGKIRAVTLGYPLGKRSFVIQFEICNLKFKGIAQYIFREFSREQPCADINIMDDSGLEDLKKVKLSYRPYKKIDNFIVRNG